MDSGKLIMREMVAFTGSPKNTRLTLFLQYGGWFLDRTSRGMRVDEPQPMERRHDQQLTANRFRCCEVRRGDKKRKQQSTL